MTGTGSPTGVSSWGEQRQPPFYCPYCAAGQSRHGAWVCRSCLRIFAVRFLGIGVRA